METPVEYSTPPQSHGSDSSTDTHLSNHHHHLLAELESLRQSNKTLQSTSAILEDNLLLFENQRDEALRQNSKLQAALGETASQRDSLCGQVTEFEVSLKEKEDWYMRSIEEERSRSSEFKKEVRICKERIEQLELEAKEAKQRNGALLKILDSLSKVKDSLLKILDCVDDYVKEIERVDNQEGSLELELDGRSKAIYEEVVLITRLASTAEVKVKGFNEKKKKELKELESSVVSLTEENRDTNSLLRVALIEKEAVEKSLNKLKGNNEPKRVALLQIAERGLQRVGFGFMMGSGNTEQPVESSGVGAASVSGSSAMSTKSDSSECEEEVVSLAATAERIMKNLRLEISQLRRTLDESRSDTERLQSLTEKQAQVISENTLYIRNLEDRERLLTQNVEELLVAIKETEAEVTRWREACQLEVEAGKNELHERDKMVEILRQELKKTKAALQISNGKLKLKEELVEAALAAQTAAERSLQVADSRATELRQRIEELTRQQEEADKAERKQRKVRHICWPWLALKTSVSNRANGRVRKRLMPEMQALLHYSV